MDLVIDTSVILAVLTSEPEKAALVALTQDANLLAPTSVHWEIGNALSAMLKRQRIAIDQAMTLLSNYGQISIRFLDVDLNDAITIASQHNLYAYDAYIIACARAERTSLVSLDKSLLKAAKASGVTVIEVPNS